MPKVDLGTRHGVRRGPTTRKLALSTLRASQEVTQTQLAARAEISQSEVSRAESRGDCLVSTLERYAGALGGELLLFVEIGGRRYPIALGK